MILCYYVVMKRFVIVLMMLIFVNSCFAADDLKIFGEDGKFGLKNSQDEVIIKPIYTKMILLGNSSYIVQKRGKFGLIDGDGNVLVPVKYYIAERILGKYLKIGNVNKYGLYDENGQQILPHEYSSIDLLFGEMFLTCKNYKYGVIRYSGEVVLENKFDDIYMPKPNVIMINNDGTWYEIEQKTGETLVLPENVRDIKGDENFSITEWVTKPATAAGYSVVTGTDYMLKLLSSISPAHEKTIDELMLSKGADTVTIFMKLGWIPKYPFVYGKNYYHTLRTPNNGPLSNVKYELKRKLQ